MYTATRTVPKLLDHIRDPALADAALSPVERAARDWRAAVLADLGGHERVSAALLALIDAAVASRIILSSVDRYLFTLAAKHGLVNKRSRRLHAIVEQRQRLADSLARQLQALGLERRAPAAPDLGSYIASRYGAGADGAAGPRHADASDAGIAEPPAGVDAARNGLCGPHANFPASEGTE